MSSNDGDDPDILNPENWPTHHTEPKPEEIEVEPEYAALLGRFVIAWGHAEDALDALFFILFKTDPTLSICISANLGVKAKIDILASAVTMLREAIAKKDVEEAHTMLREMGDLSAKYRNLLAHGRPMIPGDHEDGWQWVRFTARNELVMIQAGTDEEFWETAIEETENLRHRMFRLRNRLHKTLSHLTLEDYDRICLFRAKSK